MVKLTKKIIEDFVYQGPPPRRDARCDDEIAGFGIRIYPSGKKSFILSYRVHHRKRQLTLGDFGILTLDQARKRARQELGKIIGGHDPLEQRQHSAKVQTLKSLCEIYLSRYAKVHKKTWQEDQRRLQRHIIPRWGNLNLTSLKRRDLTDLHTSLGTKAPYEANRLLRLLSKLFELAKQWGLIDEAHPNPARNIQLYKEHKRDRWITPEELPRLIEALEREPNTFARYALWMYLLTGARKSELLQAQWTDIGWERKELRLPHTKAGRIHYIPLSTAACELLQTLPRLSDNPYLFPGHIKGKPLVNITKPWKRVCQQAQLNNVRLHDLRRTVGSWLAQSGKSLHLIGKILNHSNPSTTAIYARFSQDQGRQALEEYSEKVLASSRGIQP